RSPVSFSLFRNACQFTRQGRGPLGDIACPEKNHEIARLRNSLNNGSKGPRLRHVSRIAMAAGADPRDEGFRINTIDRLLAGRIDRSEDDAVGIIEAVCEILEEAGQASIAVRLMHGDDTARAGFASSPQHRLDLDRMMAVIVE